MWKRKVGRQEKKPFLSVCMFAEVWAAAFVFPLSSDACGLHFQNNVLSPFTAFSYANVLIFPYAFYISVGSPAAYVVTHVLIFFRGVLHAPRVGVKPPLVLQHYITHSSGHVLRAGKKKKYSLEKCIMHSVLPLLRASALRTTGTCCYHPYARTKDTLPGAWCH